MVKGTLPFKSYSLKEITSALQGLSDKDLLRSARDAITNANDHLIAVKLLAAKQAFKSAQILSAVTIEELSKAKSLMDLVEKKKTPKQVASFFRLHSLKYEEIYRQHKYSYDRITLSKQGAYISFINLKSRPQLFAQEGFESLVKHEIEDASEGIKDLTRRLEKIEKKLEKKK